MAVEFNEEQTMSVPRSPKSQGFSPIRLVQKWGLATDDRSASVVLIIVIAICIGTVLSLWFSGQSDSLSPEERAQVQKVELQLKARNGI